jgi:MFS family permease
VGVSGVLVGLVEHVWLIAVAAFVGLVIWRYLRNEPIIFAVMPMITATEVGERIATVIRNIITMIFEVAQPVLTALGIGQILVGLLLALGLRQEFLGWRLIIAGLLTLVFTYIVVPLLLSFI